jgi:hypothetical protein
MEDTSGFYKYESKQLLHAPNFVYSADFELLRENLADYSLPVDGWHYFDSASLAREYFGIPEPDQPLPG